MKYIIQKQLSVKFERKVFYMRRLRISEENLPLAQLLEHFSTHDVGGDFQGNALAFPATTVVFDLAGSSLSIRNKGAEHFAVKSQEMFRVLSDKIYEHGGVIEKFPGDGISMHFPENRENGNTSILSAIDAIRAMDISLRNRFEMHSNEYRFTMAYGGDTIITKFGNNYHEELISIGHAVNVAHKLESHIKNVRYNLAMDQTCAMVIKISGPPISLHRLNLPSNFWGESWNFERYYGGIINE